MLMYFNTAFNYTRELGKLENVKNQPLLHRSTVVTNSELVYDGV